MRPARATWGHVVVPFFYVGWVACLAQLVAGCLVLPSLARQDLRRTSANIIQVLGHSLSAYASHILKDDPGLGNGIEDQHKGLHASAARRSINTDACDSKPSSSTASSQSTPHQDARACLCNMCGQMERDQDTFATDEEYMGYLDEASNPESLRAISCPVSPCLRQLRPVLLQAQHLLEEAKVEPPWADNCAMRIEKWGILVNALNKLAVRSAALEGLLEGPEQVMSEEELRDLLGCDVVPLFKVLFAQMAASCVEMTEALRQSSRGRQGQAHMWLMLNPSYPVMEYELASALHCAINASWQRMQRDPDFRPAVQVRVLLYMGALCSGILDALTDVESKAVAALACPGKDRWFLGALTRRIHRRKHLHRHNTALRSANIHKGKVKRSLNDMLTRTSVRSGEGAVARWLRDDWGWLWPVLLQFCGYPVGEALVKAYGWALPRYLGSHKSWQLLIDLRRHRRLQFFLKYFIANASVLCAVFALSQLSTGFRKWIPYYSLLTIAVVLSEKVDTTVSKGVLRIIGSAIGGTFGYVVMLRAGLATEPVALAAIGCTATFLVAPSTLTRYKYAAYLTLVACHSLIFCQYRRAIHSSTIESPAPGHHGNVRQFYARIANIVVGVLVVLFIDLTCPWYTSVAALETLGRAYREATHLIEDYYEAFHQETQMAAQGQSPCPEVQGVAVLEKMDLIDRVQQPLSEVQVSVQKESVIWKRGLLIIPDIVHQLLYAMQVLQDRLEAVELMLMQRPIVSGRFTDYAHRHFVQPLDAPFRDVCARARKVGQLVEAVLSESTHPGHLDQLRQAVNDLQRARLHIRRQIICTQQEVVQSAEEETEWTPDDALRFQSFWFAVSRALDKCVLVARMVLEDEWIAEHARAGRWRHRQVWLGKPLSRRQEKRLRRQAAKEERERDLEMAGTR
ncbi:hypothetical protein WJX75_002805 [Coccomyxa subellipsoidea]|uniref:Integral membrane bound transporter domain-containing protein n=1 Tax=Coccomyxa subellipsoidea TaxID=248742 RepID=A0ABR2YG62_9CHLO